MWPLTMEIFSCRHFQNGREIGGLVGWLKVPSILLGVSRHERWQWLIHQPDSELSCWYEKRFGNGSRRVRKIGIVALARKLLFALPCARMVWRYLETGEIPDGAALKTIAL